MNDPALEALRDLFRHHDWATIALIDYCARLAPEQLAGSVAGTRGPILETLEHIVAADQDYLARFAVRPQPAIEEGMGASLALMRSAFVSQSEDWQSVLGRLAQFDITIPAEPNADPPWPDARHARDLLLIQAIHHGNDHRTQICTILGSKGLEVPETDGWAYWAAERWRS